MDEGEVSPSCTKPSWSAASLKRMAWAHSRDSWQAPGSVDQATETQLPSPAADDKASPATEAGPIPTKIAKWLKGCRTPLGASLDEQSSSLSKGPPRNGCSFEDDLSLGAEANHLQRSSAKPEKPSVPAREKRSQFRQKGRSMNSTGSGKSSGTVSSVSELLDLYEEDPEEILYNLGFGHEEPDIASKIPSRFFRSSSDAKGIDIKVYLGAQLQRMELENPNFALTSRFRQTEVLASVANVFTEIYSHVSGHPLQRIGSQDGDLKKNTSALNAVKILKKTLTRPNLLAAADGSPTPSPTASDPDEVEGRGQAPEPESKSQAKGFKKKDSSPLSTVAEEANQGGAGGEQEDSRSASVQNPPPPDGERPSPSTSVQNPPLSDVEGLSSSASEESAVVSPGSPLVPVLVSVSEAPNMMAAPEQRARLRAEQHKAVPSSLLSVRLSQPRDSFEMEELQSTEDEVPGTGSLSQLGREHMLRTTSQQSDSSGFAEEPSTDIFANYLKVQESTDSCDSETTVTGAAGGLSSPLVLDHPAYETLQEELPQPSTGRCGLARVHEEAAQCVDQVVPASGSAGDLVPPAVASWDLPDMLGSASETNPSSPSSSSTTLGPVAECDSAMEQSPSPERGSDHGVASELGGELSLSASDRLQGALLRAQQRAPSACEERTGRLWFRTRDLLRDAEAHERYPLQRSSSLPNSWVSLNRVVSSVHIRLGQGVVRHYPHTYKYRYEEKEEADGSVAKGDEDEPQPRCRSTLLINPTPDRNAFAQPPETQTDGGSAVPPYPLNVPQQLTRSASSLYSAPADWSGGRLAEAPLWSTCSVPDLSQPTSRPHPLLPQSAHHHSANYIGEVGNAPAHRGVKAPRYGHTPGPVDDPYTHTHTAPCTLPQNPPFPHILHTAPQGVPYSQTHLPYSHPLSVPYSGLAPPHSLPQNAPYGFNMQSGPYHPQMPVAYSHTAPYPHYPITMYGHQYHAPFDRPSSLLPPSMTPTPAMGSTEMQLRRVLHDIRDTVQSLGQSPTMPRGSRSSAPQSPQQPYEELQMRRQSLNVFRTQMMELELTLMRQQAMVYQHLSPEERREAEQLQRLRAAVRQELQELELQLEDRFLSIKDQLFSAQHSRLCRHPLSMTRGHSIDSLSSSSALRAMEPVCDLLQEQLSLQSQLIYDAPISAVGSPISGRSSRAPSPPTASRPPTCCSPSPARGGMYRSSISLTPVVPPRPGAETHEHAPTDSPGPDTSQGTGELRLPQEPRGGGTAGGGNAHLQQIIAEIKQNLAEEIRQEILNELLAAVSPRRSPVPAREPPA
ncbi:protein ITPRID2 [Electrophorus electricus]|uniref:protein ITPRID2 n=1 Tax=Electrophorus electricus TaxID=8005 RepID=UPI0015D00E42|nr:protein ITPRID2 [Electrophorus electricus]XP_035379798.1 protein ITPRID2 [Electrophorus electricus]XP_035379799.1 protein ITPRID2 [Electrophorus electricus]XP_035379800.1 protein ITPRID2 [Electrophorus electricus]XP_035379801.1 protein ITPRID2 [Electrophorus electricus]XP_035379802.1 protein ITPRID2 [Electrophorus electricus]